MKISALIILLLLLPVSLSLGDDEGIFSTSYICTDSEGADRWTATSDIEHSQGDADNIFVLTEYGEGIYSGFKDEISWVSELRFESTEDLVKPIRYQKRVFNDMKELLAVETQEFDYVNKKVLCVNNDLTEKKKITKEFDFRFDVVNRLILCLYVQKFLEKGIMEKRVDLLSSEPNIYSVVIKVIDEEIIDLDGEELRSYKLCLDPNLGLLSIFKIFLPKAYIWHLARADFAWLRYEGPESNPTSIKVVIETTG